MAVVMLITYGRKKSRSKMLAFVIGMFLHLVFDGAFTNTKMFWWPISGLQLAITHYQCSTAGSSTFHLK